MADATESGVQESARGFENLEGKYLTFMLAEEEYGIEIMKVVEIIKMMGITSVPRVPDYVRGVINLRGKVIPVVELRKRFAMSATEDTDQTCIIVVNGVKEGRTVQMGILVDTVSEVLDIEAREIEAAPQFGSGIDTSFILGMAKSGEDVRILLDIDSVLSGTDVGGVI